MNMFKFSLPQELPLYVETGSHEHVLLIHINPYCDNVAQSEVFEHEAL
jgi:hypothetical protein